MNCKLNATQLCLVDTANNPFPCALLQGSLKVWKYPLPEHVEMDPIVGTFLKLPSNEPVNILARVYVVKVHDVIKTITHIAVDVWTYSRATLCLEKDRETVVVGFTV